jgi:hypothetical protein
MDLDQLDNLLWSLEESGESAAVSVADHIRTVAANGPEYSTPETLLEEAENLAAWANRFADLVRQRGN